LRAASASCLIFSIMAGSALGRRLASAPPPAGPPAPAPIGPAWSVGACWVQPVNKTRTAKTRGTRRILLAYQTYFLRRGVPGPAVSGGLDLPPELPPPLP